MYRAELYPVNDGDIIVTLYTSTDILTDECCYQYNQIPATPSGCDGDINTTAVVNLVCSIHYWLDTMLTNVELKWYRSTREETAGTRGENIIDRSRGGKYDITPVQSNNVITSFLVIANFNVSEDGGYYWCQIVINNISLSPSPYGSINNHPCTSQASCRLDQPLCEHNSTELKAYIQRDKTHCTLQNAKLNTTSTVPNSSEPPTTMILDIDLDSTVNCRNCTLQETKTTIPSSKIPTVTMILSTDSTVMCDFSTSGYLCSFGIIIGIALLIIVSLLVLVILLHKNRKKQGKSSLYGTP